MTLLKFVDKKWGPIGSFNWFATHGTSMSRTNSLISGDNKGAAARFMEDWSKRSDFFEGTENMYPDAFHTGLSKLNGIPKRLTSIIIDLLVKRRLYSYCHIFFCYAPCFSSIKGHNHFRFLFFYCCAANELMEIAACFQASGGRPVKSSLSTAQRVRGTLSQGDRPRFVSAFCQTNCGDVSPNVLGTFCIDTGLPCDFNHSTCNGKNELCYGRGPG